MANKVNKMNKLIKASQLVTKAVEALRAITDDSSVSGLADSLQAKALLIGTLAKNTIDEKLTTNKETKQA